MIISISGYPGSGKSSVAKALADKMGYRFYSMGDMRGKMAMDKGMTLDELNALGEKDFCTDEEIDAYQKKLAEKEDNFIIDGRLSFYFIPRSRKVYLDVEEHKAAERLMKSHKLNDRPDEAPIKSIEEAIDRIHERVESDRKRYRKYYSVDCYDKKNYEVVIDTTTHKVSDTVNEVVKQLNLYPYIKK
jgi:predicted cytidylate kinase